ncbi:MAG: hypothetical protein ACW981_17105 [Candidatus Hodarchaeales archaeon]
MKPLVTYIIIGALLASLFAFAGFVFYSLTFNNIETETTTYKIAAPDDEYSLTFTERSLQESQVSSNLIRLDISYFSDYYSELFKQSTDLRVPAIGFEMNQSSNTTNPTWIVSLSRDILQEIVVIERISNGKVIDESTEEIFVRESYPVEEVPQTKIGFEVNNFHDLLLEGIQNSKKTGDTNTFATDLFIFLKYQEEDGFSTIDMIFHNTNKISVIESEYSYSDNDVGPSSQITTVYTLEKQFDAFHDAVLEYLQNQIVVVS